MRKTFTAALLMISVTIQAQDLNYWTNQFGTRASLMGGAVVGGIRDNTAIYYNPAALAFIDSSSVSVNANLYKAENIRLVNAVGDAKTLRTLNLGTIPLLVGGRLKTRNPKMGIGYGIIVPVNFTFKGGARTEGFFPITESPDSPGEEEYTGQVNVNAKLKETTAIVGLSWKLSDKWSWGLSNLFVVRTHAFTEATIVRMFLNNNSKTLVAINDIANTRYTHVAYVPKLGINYLDGNWAWGATLTLPGLRILGNGTVTADVTGNQVDLFGTGRFDFSGSDAQEKLKTKYKHPLSFSVGGVHTTQKNRIGFSAQYYTSIDAYSILTPAPKQFLRPAATFPGFTTDAFLQVRTAAKPVLNAAIAYENYLSDKLTFTASVRTDFSAYDADMKKERGIKPYITTWDIYHLASGVTLHQGRHDLSIGLNLSYGADNNYQQSVNLDDPSEANFLQGQLEVAEARYFSGALILGYTFLFRR